MFGGVGLFLLFLSVWGVWCVMFKGRGGGGGVFLCWGGGVDWVGRGGGGGGGIYY